MTVKAVEELRAAITCHNVVPHECLCREAAEDTIRKCAAVCEERRDSFSQRGDYMKANGAIDCRDAILTALEPEGKRGDDDA